MGDAKVKVNERELRDFRRRVGRGLLNWAYAVEGAAKREAPVRGGYRSFLTTKKTKAGREGRIPIGPDNGSVYIGGTLRRSIHSAVWVDGELISGSAKADENGRPIPEYVPEKGIMAVVGTNCDYGAYVEIGTVKMRERPFLGPAVEAMAPRLAVLVRAGMRAK